MTALLAGTFIYITERPTSLVAFGWLAVLGLGDAVSALRGWSDARLVGGGDWILWSMPAGLWAFAGAIAMRLVWWRDYSRVSVLWFVTIPLLGVASEFGQLGGVPGTFDVADIAAYVAAGLLAVPVTNLLEARR
jgi:hypothetical protein